MSWRARVTIINLFLFLGTSLFGCGGKVSHEWEIAAENRGDVGVDFAVTFGMRSPTADNSGNASVANVAKGKSITLVAGPGKTMVKTVKVTRKGEAQELTPEAEIEPGKKFLIIVGTDGKVSGSVVSR